MHTIDDLATGAHDLGAGHSTSDDPWRAGLEALSGAMGTRMPRAGDLVFVFADAGYDASVLMGSITTAAGPATVVGCSAMGSFTSGAFGPHGLTVVHVPGADVSSGIAIRAAADGDLHTAAHDAAAEAKRLAGGAHPHSVLLVLSSQTGAQRDVVRGAYEVTGARVPLVGGAAAADPTERSWIASNGQVVPTGVTAIWLNSPRRLGVAVDHGLRPISRPLVVTMAEGNVILELDGRPAAQVYVEARGRPFPAGSDRHVGSDSLDRPLGVPTIGGAYEVRHILDRTGDGGLEMSGHVHDQAVVRVMAGELDELLDGARRAVRAAVQGLERPPRGLLAFTCTARRLLLGDRVDHERRIMADELGSVVAGGFFSSGEYARTTGSTGFHSASVAALAL